VDSHKQSIARSCLEAAESNTMTFPCIVETLMSEGFEGYIVDLRRGMVSYYMPDGDGIDLPTRKIDTRVAASFDRERVKAAIKQAQQLAPGYTYTGFCKTVAAAGCAGYIVSFSGRRALYFGRTAETHVEYFPN
jgi:uncharacterized protein YbcV (DUF1398 family)